jgi:hypothetical protein
MARKTGTISKADEGVSAATTETTAMTATMSTHIRSCAWEMTDTIVSISKETSNDKEGRRGAPTYIVIESLRSPSSSMIFSILSMRTGRYYQTTISTQERTIGQ